MKIRKGNSYQKYLKQKHSKITTDKTVLEKVVKKVTGSDIVSMHRIIEGEVNEVYDIKTSGMEVIVRVSHSDSNRFIAEKWAIEEAEKVGVPVAQILLLDEVKDKGNKLLVCVETKLRGKSLRQIINQNEMSESELKKLIVSSGVLLAKIHSVKPQKYGRLLAGGVGRYDTWSEYVLSPTKEDRLQGIIESGEKAHIPRKNIERMAEILISNSDIYKTITPHLLHGDFGPKHTFVEGGEITGILDFENCKSGDPIYDFSWWSYFGKNRPPINWLKEGYERASKLPEKFDLLLRLGRLRLGLDMIWYYQHEGNISGIKVAKQNLKEDLNYFDRK